MSRTRMAAALVLAGTAISSAASCAAGEVGVEPADPTSVAPAGSVSSTVVEAAKGGTVPAGGCVLIRPPARWILRAPDVDPTPGQPGYIDVDSPPPFSRDPACQSTAALFVAPTTAPGRYTIILTQDDHKLLVPVTVAAP